MKNFALIRHLIALRQSYWFIPMIMIIASIGLAAIVVKVDRAFYLPETTLFSWINNLGPGGARAVFSTIAGSTITVAGTIFSIAMVVLVMASNQFGPRLIPTFMRVGKIQFGFGLFVGTFVYCLLMLTFVPDENKGELLPVWGVLVGVALGILAFLVLIMLIHELATFIQAPVITQRVSEDIIHTFERVFPEQDHELIPDSGSEKNNVSNFVVSQDAWSVGSVSKGYVATVDFERLVEIGELAGCVLLLQFRPGDYLIEGQQLMLVDGYHGNREELIADVCKAISFSSNRNLTQDARYAIDQMVEIAVRALSPGVNDPFTAVNCVDKLGSALAHLSRRRIALRSWKDEQGDVRLVTKPETYEEIVESAFGQIRHYAINAPNVLQRIIESIGRLAALELHPEMRQALYDQMLAMEDALTDSLPFAHDRRELEQRYREVIAMFELEGDRTTRIQRQS